MPTKYAHAEAYCIMKYRSDDGTEEQLVWNSRDGVTPYVIRLPSGKEARHVEWENDIRDPDYLPPPGSFIFIDLTPEAARAYALRNAEKFFTDSEMGPLAREVYNSVQDMAEDLIADYLRPGAPDLMVVTEEYYK